LLKITRIPCITSLHGQKSGDRRRSRIGERACGPGSRFVMVAGEKMFEKIKKPIIFSVDIDTVNLYKNGFIERSAGR